MREMLSRLLQADANDAFREQWLQTTLESLPPGLRILDAGAGELRNKIYCKHLNYTSQDFGKYDGQGDQAALQTGSWDTSRIDVVCDITSIPLPDSSFEVILCSEVLEHLPDPTSALDELSRLLSPGGRLILTAPFASLVHFAPYYFSSGFSKYWYEHHLQKRGFSIVELTPNGDWFAVTRQELLRWWKVSKSYGDYLWPLALSAGYLCALLLCLGRKRRSSELCCFGWHCVAVKDHPAIDEQV